VIRDTSDALVQLARERLLNARLASFPITDTIDALTLGSVNFLPKRIAEAITVFTPATEAERQQIAPRLQQILISRVSTAELPSQLTDVIISTSSKRQDRSFLD
jgi:DNA-binding transcriptional regulator YbjK